MLRYSAPVARLYDTVSCEHLYRPGRLAAVRALELTAGARVLDVGCGTGLSLPALVAATAPGGTVVGVDASPAMLERARRRRHPGVTFVLGTAAGLGELPDLPYDGALFAYSLSVMADWETAWRAVLTRVRPGGRVAVADTARTSLFTRLAMAAGGVHPDRRPWELVRRDLREVTHDVLAGGHVHVAAGSRP